jgi:hypothetical protein
MSPHEAKFSGPGVMPDGRRAAPESAPGIQQPGAARRLNGALSAVGRLAVIALALILIMPTIGVSDSLSSKIPDDVDPTFLVSNPPEEFVAVISGLGFSIIEDTRLEDLSLHIYRIQGPEDQSIEDAMSMIAARFPGIEIDRDVELELNSKD